MKNESKRAIRQFVFLCGVIALAFAVGLFMDLFVDPAGRATSLIIMVGIFAACALLLLAIVAGILTARRSRQQDPSQEPKQRFPR